MLTKPTSGLMPTYKRMNVAFERGQGAWLFDTDGNKYLDTISGISVCNLGHCHPRVTKAISYQAGKLVHTSNLYRIPLQEQLANKLTALSGMDACFFCNSGAEANEAAIKLARLHGHQTGKATPAIIVMDGSFHGRTLATLSATGNRKVQAGFEPLVSGFVRAPFDDLDAIKTIAKSNPNVCAILAEPIQGEGGVHVPDQDYLDGLRKICDEYDWLLMLDEVQTGNGRTGQYFAYQHTQALPDVLTTAKGLANGVPIGVCLTQGAASQLMQPGSHGSTFGGNPLACAAALAVIDTIEQENLLERVETLGHQILSGLKAQFKSAAYIKDIRGQGLMIGIELDRPCIEFVALAKIKGLLINVTQERTIRLLPPFILDDEEADLLIDGISKMIKVYVGDDRMKPRD